MSIVISRHRIGTKITITYVGHSGTSRTDQNSMCKSSLISIHPSYLLFNKLSQILRHAFLILLKLRSHAFIRVKSIIIFRINICLHTLKYYSKFYEKIARISALSQTVVNVNSSSLIAPHCIRKMPTFTQKLVKVAS